MLQRMEELSKLTKQLNILYVEDDPIASKVIAELLEELFNEVIVAKDGLEAIHKFQDTANIQLVISDINMPKMNGLEMVSTLYRLDSNIKIIMLTQHTELDLFIEGMRLQVDGYVLKPIDFNNLFNEIEKVLSNTKL